MEGFVVGLSVTVIGISTVMLILFGLSYIVNFLKVFNKEKEKEPVGKPAREPVQQQLKEEPEPLENAEQENSLEIIAVITAAAAAYLNKPEDKFIIRSIKRTNSWNEAARRERRIRG